METVKLVALGVAYVVLMALAGCSHAPPPPPKKPITMGDELVCFFSRAEQKGEALICGESVLMCEAIRSEEYDRGAEVGPCTKRIVALSKE